MIQSRIEDYRKEMMARVSQGDVLLPNDLNAYRAMAGVWAPSAFMNAMKKINVSGTGMKKIMVTSAEKLGPIRDLHGVGGGPVTNHSRLSYPPPG